MRRPYNTISSNRLLTTNHAKNHNGKQAKAKEDKPDEQDTNQNKRNK